MAPSVGRKDRSSDGGCGAKISETGNCTLQARRNSLNNEVCVYPDPPPYLTMAATLSSTDGWVANRPDTGRIAGVSMKKACMRDGMSGIAEWPSILRNALIIASGFLVKSTEPASAMNSRERDMAKRMTIESPQEIAMIAIAIRITMMIAAPFLSRSREREVAGKRGPRAKGKSTLRIVTSAMKAKSPAKMTAITIIWVSRLRIWV